MADPGPQPPAGGAGPARDTGATTLAAAPDVEDIEFALLLDGIETRYGYDLRDYVRGTLKRRVLAFVNEEGLNSISALQEQVLRQPDSMARFLRFVLINVTSMFRDQEFYRAFRGEVVPRLPETGLIRIWVPGCSSGEEVYSLAIVLSEAGLYHRCLIYATDMTESILAQARAGIFPVEKMRDFTRNYQKAGGTQSFSDYYTAKYGRAILRGDLKANVVWAVHNLVTDGSINEFQFISCRNVLIAFNHALQSRAHDLLYDSLAIGGVLALGSGESIAFSPHEKLYKALNQEARIYVKVKQPEVRAAAGRTQ